MPNPNLYEVFNVLLADLRATPGVRAIETRDFVSSDMTASRIPVIGLSEESLDESHLPGARRRVTFNLRLSVIVQGETEARARALRDQLRREINWVLEQNTIRDSWAILTDMAPVWTLGIHEDPKVLTMERTLSVQWDEDCLER